MLNISNARVDACKKQAKEEARGNLQLCMWFFTRNSNLFLFTNGILAYCSPYESDAD